MEGSFYTRQLRLVEYNIFRDLHTLCTFNALSNFARFLCVLPTFAQSFRKDLLGVFSRLFSTWDPTFAPFEPLCELRTTSPQFSASTLFNGFCTLGPTIILHQSLSQARFTISLAAQYSESEFLVALILLSLLSQK